MIHTRTNKSETTVEIIKVDEIAFLRGKLEDRKYKVQVFLKCGTIIHMNLDKDEFQKLRDVFSGINKEYKTLKPNQVAISIPEEEKSIEELAGKVTYRELTDDYKIVKTLNSGLERLSEVVPITLDDLLTDSPEGSK